METFFPKCRPSLLEETSRTTTPTKARNNAKKNNSRDNNNNTTTTSSTVPFSDILCFCVPFVCSSPKQPLFYTRALLLLRVVFLVSRVDLSEDIERTTQNCTTQRISNSSSFIVKRLKVCFQKNDTNVSLSLCSFFCFKKKLFRRKGKRTIKERNASRVTCSNENVNAKKKP